ncbi:MAG: glycosyltransferase [Candidatus Dadabacteria bacterium]|nr:glycosyltransferase [Candidatus Dadabacteria bacterium]
MVNEKNLLNFRIEGFVDHSKVSKYLLASDILVLPYSNEITIKDGTQAKQFTSPIKLFEYLASGKPIVATDLPSIIEILRNNENSIIVEPDNVDALVNSLQKLYFDNELSERISKKALSDAKNYSWEKRVIRIIDGLNILRKYMLLLRN